MNIHPLFRIAPLLLPLAVAAGCGKKEDAKTATQVAAKVNAYEITVHQINSILARSRNVTPHTMKRPASTPLKRLIR